MRQDHTLRAVRAMVDEVLRSCPRTRVGCVGYRRMQQRDFDAAHDAFEEALEVEL